MNNKVKDNLFAAAVTAMIIAAVVLVNVVLYSLTAINGWHIAYAEELDLTISGNTDDLFADAIKEGRKVRIIFCRPEDELASHTTGRDVLETAKQFKEKYPEFIDLVFYNIRTQEDVKDKNGNVILDAETVRNCRFDDLGNETVLHAGSVIFMSTETDGAGGTKTTHTVLGSEYGGVSYVDFYHLDADGYITAYNGEETIASRILWTLADEHKIAYFTQGHGETLDISFLNMLMSAGYYFKAVDLLRTDLYRSSQITDEEELKNKKDWLDRDRAGVLIISNPTADFAKGGATTRTEIEKISDYLSGGGQLYVAVDSFVSSLPNLEGLLKEYGVEFAKSQIDGGAVVKNTVKDPRNAITTDGYTFVANYADNDIGKKLAEKTDKYVSDDVIVKNVSALTLSGSAKPVLVTSSAASVVASGAAADKSGEYCVGALSEKTFGNKTARIFVTSGVYLAAADAVVSDSYANRNFTYALFDVAFGASVAPYGCRLVPYGSDMLEDLTMGRARLYTAFIMAIPVAIAVLGIIVNKRRKNR